MARRRRTPLRLPRDPAERVHFGRRTAFRGFGPPSRARDHTGFDELEAVEEAGDLLGGTLHVRDRAGLVVVLRGLLVPLSADDAGAVVEGQVAPRRQGI